MGYLLVIDDQKIRHAAFQTAAKLFKKINRIETDLAFFPTTDQLRFEDWEALTFCHLQERMKQSQGELRRLYEFHNWVVAVSHQRKMSMIESLTDFLSWKKISAGKMAMKLKGKKLKEKEKEGRLYSRRM